MKVNLTDLNIFTLRDLARRTGVVSPTSKTKAVLIQEITDIVEGRQSPSLEGKRKGRPPKMFGYDIANVFEQEDVSSQKEDISIIKFNQSIEQMSDEDMLTVVGILELVGGNAGLLWVCESLTNETYFISAEVLSRIDVRTGDRIVAQVSNGVNQKIVKSVFSINGLPILKMDKKRKNCSDFEVVQSRRDLEFFNEAYNELGLKQGQNCYLYGDDNNDNSLVAIDLVNSVNCDNKIYLNLSLAEKNKILLKDLKNCELFVAGVVDDVDVARRITMLAIERVKRILETKESVVVVVDDLLSVSGVDNDKLNLVRNIVALAKDTKQQAAITLLSVMPNNELKFVEKLADVRLKIQGVEVSQI